MNSQKLEQEVVQYEKSELEQAEDGLLLLLTRFPDYFQERAKRNDIETLTFCLHHLYNCFTTLYQHILPTLTRLTAAQEQVPHSPFAHRHAIWEQLHAMLLLLERVESHCHLLLSTTTHVLAALDNTEERAFSTETPSYVGTDEWQHAYEQLSAVLVIWQEQHTTPLIFANAFAPLSAALSHATLSSVDSALALLFDSANAIFGDIIPDLQLVAQGDDEVVATLLFDLMQQNDLLLLQISKLVERRCNS